MLDTLSIQVGSTGTDDDLIGHIRTALAGSPFVGEGYRKVWTRYWEHRW